MNQLADEPTDSAQPRASARGLPLGVKTISQVQALLAAQPDGAKAGADSWPAVRLFAPLAHASWLLVRLDPADPDQAFGWCDIGDGHARLGQVSLTELSGRFGHMSVRWDPGFRADRPLRDYAAQAGTTAGAGSA